MTAYFGAALCFFGIAVPNARVLSLKKLRLAVNENSTNTRSLELFSRSPVQGKHHQNRYVSCLAVYEPAFRRNRTAHSFARRSALSPPCSALAYPARHEENTRVGCPKHAEKITYGLCKARAAEHGVHLIATQLIPPRPIQTISYQVLICTSA